MATIHIDFNAPLPNNQQKIFMKNLKELGFSVERVFQGGKYIKFRYFGRLPTLENQDNVIVQFVDDKAKTDLSFHKIEFVEFYLYFERKNENENCCKI